MEADLLTKLIAIGGIGGSTALFLSWVAVTWKKLEWKEVGFNHFRATIGLPAAAAGAFIVVALFRTTEGEIKFDALGFHFEGASGPIIMWLLCFLAITIAIKTLW